MVGWPTLLLNSCCRRQMFCRGIPVSGEFTPPRAEIMRLAIVNCRKSQETTARDAQALASIDNYTRIAGNPVNESRQLGISLRVRFCSRSLRSPLTPAQPSWGQRRRNRSGERERSRRPHCATSAILLLSTHPCVELLSLLARATPPVHRQPRIGQGRIEIVTT